ncbi:MAG: AAA family ATPase [Candidatus Colwellbacteria bacterium]|nr:AAA family ATPase [Candidatus Colwellbacteria bacterium]
MLLRRLKLQGFKSFADKTVLDLSHNVTAIVGPNGSGKSNLTDSVRWLLGERDARNLRGGKGEDLIFAGTKTKPRAGQAWASLHFSNESGFLPVAYKDVVITRKVTRDGSSLFTINKSEVRLKDVLEFFAKSKTGARGFNIIGQGESDVFIKATPQERREMIEELLGLKEYQMKKGEALRKLKSTAFNLEKAQALIQELEPHLRLLRKQARRYEGREDAEKELTNLENYFYGYQLLELEKGIKTQEAEEKENRALLRAEKEKLANLQKDLERIKDTEPQSAGEFPKIKLEEEKLHRERAELQIELGKMEVRLELTSEESADVPKLKQVLAEVRKVSEKLMEESGLESIREGLKKIIKLTNLAKETGGRSNEQYKKTYQETAKEINKLERELEGIRDRAAEINKSLQGFNESFTKAYELVAKQQAKVNEAVSLENDRLIKKERLEIRLEALLEELKQIGRPKDSLAVNAVKLDLTDDEIRQKMLKLRSYLASIGEVDETVIKEANETEERHAFLVAQVEDLGKAMADLQKLTVELDRKIHDDFNIAITKIDREFHKLVQLVFGGGKASLKLEKVKVEKRKTEINEAEDSPSDEPDRESPDDSEPEAVSPGVLIDVTLPKKRIKGLEVLSGGERALVSIAALFSLVSVSPPPFLFLDEVDAALDERNARRFGEILKEFAQRTQFVIVTHNRATMEVADALYGVTMAEDGTSKLVSLKLT